MTSNEFIIPILNVLMSFLILMYSIILSVKRQRPTFVVSIILSVMFLVSSAVQLWYALTITVTFNMIYFYAPLFVVILFWGIMLYLFDIDLKKKFGTSELKDMHRIESTEKEYIDRMRALFKKRGKEVKDKPRESKKITDSTDLKLPKPLFIVGMKETGKSTIGRILSAKLGTSFIDADDMILKAIQPRFQSLKQLYIAKGPLGYMQTETAIIYKYLKSSKENSIIALGGGIASNQSALKLARDYGTVLFLSLPPETLFRRINRDGAEVTFINKAHPYESFHEVYEKRTDVYKRAADVVVELNETDTPLINANKVLRRLEAFYESPESKKPRRVEPTNIIRVPRQSVTTSQGASTTTPTTPSDDTGDAKSAPLAVKQSESDGKTSTTVASIMTNISDDDD